MKIYKAVFFSNQTLGFKNNNLKIYHSILDMGFQYMVVQQL